MRLFAALIFAAASALCATAHAQSGPSPGGPAPNGPPNGSYTTPAGANSVKDPAGLPDFSGVWGGPRGLRTRISPRSSRS